MLFLCFPRIISNVFKNLSYKYFFVPCIPAKRFVVFSHLRLMPIMYAYSRESNKFNGRQIKATSITGFH